MQNYAAAGRRSDRGRMITLRNAEPAPRHTPAIEELYRRLLRAADVEGRFVPRPSGRRVHVAVAGDGPPVVHLHGTNTSSLSHLMLPGRTPGLRSYLLDRPGCGLSAIRSAANARSVPSRASTDMAAVRSALHRQGLRFRKHTRPLASLRCHADIVFPRERIAVFVDGCFWHGCVDHGRQPGTNSDYWRAKIGRNVRRDRRNDEALAEAGWLVVRAWEHEPVESVVARVSEIVSERRVRTGDAHAA